ncbi:MAG: dipeptide/oligopeptide/nickel ABC transporter permease/ATP-binding protein [Arachnia propionica]|uniref:dipeptide/oligopeptide/nickel ABC transporter permease/ATP-binding protein n=1 Tax=Arachnia propionica TaxID=1750 RepID=UPI0027059E6C|nr:dipeptide/oligopeptide/nickel ABC transporter permease/ATP-binding protein [Arachnia propionica]
MLSAESRKKLQTPGLRLPALGSLPIGSRIALVVLGVIALMAILAPWLAPYSPDASGLVPDEKVLQIETEIEGVGKQLIPDHSIPPDGQFWFGTDKGGRDIASRIMHGARVSLTVGLAATGLALLVAAVLGSIAATARKWVSETLMRVLDVIMSFPGIALAAVMVTALSSRVPNILVVVIISISFLYVPQLTRVVRANVLSQFGEDYVAASKVMGARTWWILIKHVARNCLAPIMVFATVLVADAIVFEASLSFIGTGITSVNTPTWGNMLSEGKELLLSGHWWVTFFPGMFILITTLCLNVLSEGLTDALASPRIRVKADVEADELASRGERDAVIAAAHAEQAVKLRERLALLRSSEQARTDRLVLADPQAKPLLEVQNLSISFPSAHGGVQIVDDVSFSVRPGETMGLVGESGCGKSITSMAVMGLLPKTAHVQGEIWFDGVNLLTLNDTERNALRGHEMAMIYQDALSSLNPSMLIRSQMKQLTSRGGTREAAELLEMVGLDPLRTLRSYPHELSGGQRQRVLIAMALTRNPQLVIADEPTTALDVTVQAQVVELLNELRQELGFAMVFVSHDLALVAEVAHRITVMYAGQVVEQANTSELLTNPVHEYTQGLLGAVLSIEEGAGRLHQVPGTVPSPREFVAGDRFAPRSSHPGVGLETKPELLLVGGTTDHYWASTPELREVLNKEAAHD